CILLEVLWYLAIFKPRMGIRFHFIFFYTVLGMAERGARNYGRRIGCWWQIFLWSWGEVNCRSIEVDCCPGVGTR
ncbi:unnamed protein product, partial [Tuber aestivum]